MLAMPLNWFSHTFFSSKSKSPLFVTCHMLHVMCHMLHIKYPMPVFFLWVFFYKMVELVDEGFVMGCLLMTSWVKGGGEAQTVQVKSVTFLLAQKNLITFLKKRVILMRDILRQIRINPIFFINTILQWLSKLCWMK